MAAESQDCNAPDRLTEARNFRLYVAGQTPKSVLALLNLQQICGAYLRDSYHIEVIDVLVDPHRAAEDHVLAVPTLIQLNPKPARRIVGDLADTARVLMALDVSTTPPDNSC